MKRKLLLFTFVATLVYFIVYRLMPTGMLNNKTYKSRTFYKSRIYRTSNMLQTIVEIEIGIANYIIFCLYVSPHECHATIFNRSLSAVKRR